MELRITCRISYKNDSEYSLLAEESAKGVFEDCQIYSIQEPYSKRELNIELTDDLTVDALYNEVLRSFSHNVLKQLLSSFPLTDAVFCMNNIVFNVESSGIKVKDLVTAFNTNSMLVILTHLLGAGEYCRCNGYRFYFYSHEGNRHNEPHIHVDKVGKRSGSVLISTLEQTEGNLNDKDLRFIRSKLKGRERELLEWWNLKTDGINVDIDFFLQNRIIKEENV